MATPATAETLDWDDDARERKRYDVVIASDCVFNSTAGLFSAAVKICTNNDPTNCLRVA